MAKPLTVTATVLTKDYPGGTTYTWQAESLEAAQADVEKWALEDFGGAPIDILGPIPGRGF